MQKSITSEKLMQVAQDVVDDWRADENRPAFAHYLASHDPSRCPWPCLDLNEADRRTFLVLAEAIRTGRGHAYTNPDPLLAIARAEPVGELIPG